MKERSNNMTSLARLKTFVKRNEAVVATYEWMDKQLRFFLRKISPALVVRYAYFRKYGRLPNLDCPTSFDEKLLWLMVYWRHPLKVQCSDKFAVRDYVKQNGYAAALADLIGVYSNIDEIQPDKLPKRFAIKATHGSSMNLICTDRDSVDWDSAKRQMATWLRQDISNVAGEIQYSEIQPRLICEEYLGDANRIVPVDYKLFCFAGKVHCTMVCTGRYTNAGSNFYFYDAGWVTRLPYSKKSMLDNRSISRPVSYARMVEMAETLSHPFPFVRVDLYEVNGKAVFGEMTYTQNGCIDRDYTDLAQEKLGGLISLPEKRLQ